MLKTPKQFLQISSFIIRISNIYPILVKLGFTGVQLILLFFFIQNIDSGYSLEPPQQGGSNVYPQLIFLANISSKAFFSNEFLIFTAEKKICKLHGQVFVIYKYM